MITQILVEVIYILESCNVAGKDAEEYGKALKALRALAAIGEKKERVKKHENHDEQRHGAGGELDVRTGEDDGAPDA